MLNKKSITFALCMALLGSTSISTAGVQNRRALTSIEKRQLAKKPLQKVKKNILNSAAGGGTAVANIWTPCGNDPDCAACDFTVTYYNYAADAVGCDQ